MKRLISPSILNVEKDLIISSIHEVEKCGAEMIHFDIMDGIFVPAKSFSFEEAKKYMDETSVIKDVHIMVSDLKLYAEKYCKYGADILTFHYEACNSEKELNETIDFIKSKNVKVGVSIKPNTPVNILKNILHKIDLVLIMSVEPGEGGQPFNENTYERISELRKLSNDLNKELLIEIDGGIKPMNAKKCFDYGANILVAGTYIFKGESIKERFASLNE